MLQEYAGRVWLSLEGFTGLTSFSPPGRKETDAQADGAWGGRTVGGAADLAPGSRAGGPAHTLTTLTYPPPFGDPGPNSVSQGLGRAGLPKAPGGSSAIPVPMLCSQHPLARGHGIKSSHFSLLLVTCLPLL